MSKDDSPPAFPQAAVYDKDRGFQPSAAYIGHSGMSQRQFYAAAALSGIRASFDGDVDEKGIAKLAFAQADAMIAYEKDEQP